MTQEQIEKEIKKRLDTPDNQWDSIFNSGFSRGFSQGAKWRIASVWHENTMKPNKDCHVLLEDIFGNIYDDEYCAVCDEFDSSIEWKEIKRWVYIKDLLPEEK